MIFFPLFQEQSMFYGAPSSGKCGTTTFFARTIVNQLLKESVNVEVDTECVVSWLRSVRQRGWIDEWLYKCDAFFDKTSEIDKICYAHSSRVIVYVDGVW